MAVLIHCLDGRALKVFSSVVQIKESQLNTSGVVN